jgi:Dynamin family
MNEASHITASKQMAPRLREHDRTQALADVLGRIEPTLKSAVGSASPLAARLRGLRDRLQHERFQLAVLGQFKRGKSTFINALLGAAVLPTGVVPLTAVAIFIAWRRTPLVIVHFKGDEPSEEFASQTPEEIHNVLPSQSNFFFHSLRGILKLVPPQHLQPAP